MAELKKVSGIDISEDMDFQRREWVVQRVGWVVIALLLLAGLLGLFGKGPLGRGEAGDPAGQLSLRFDRIDHYQADSKLAIHAGPDAVQGDELRLTLNQSYLDRIEVAAISPEPVSVELAGDKQVFIFKVADPAQGSDVLFQYRFAKIGSATGQLGLEGGSELSFKQFVYP